MSVGPNQTTSDLTTPGGTDWGEKFASLSEMDSGREIWRRRDEEAENLTLLWFIFNSLGALIITLLLIKGFYVSNQKVDRQIKEWNTNFLPFNYLYNTTPRASLPCLSPQTQWKTVKRDLTLYNSSLSNKMGDGGEKIHTPKHTITYTRTHKALRLYD